MTTNPPKILMDASIIAIKPNNADKPDEAGPIAKRAPTIITLEIALVTDIKGE